MAGKRRDKVETKRGKKGRATKNRKYKESRCRQKVSSFPR